LLNEAPGLPPREKGGVANPAACGQPLDICDAIQSFRKNGGTVTGSLSPNQRKAHMDRIYHDWDKALSENDAEALLKLYAKDAVIESPLIPHLLGKADGVCRGQDEMRPFFEAVATRKPSLRNTTEPDT